MAIILRNQDTQSDLQQRVTAELREKQIKKDLVDPNLTGPKYDGSNSEYAKNTKSTTKLAWAWALIFFCNFGHRHRCYSYHFLKLRGQK